MAIFVRPATWSYDIELFRAATADEDQLEALLAATATADQALWVAESNERPAAFVWTKRETGCVRLLRVYASPGEDPRPLLTPLLQRIRDEAGAGVRLETDAGASGVLGDIVRPMKDP
jgi:hypothetical protein